MTLLKLIFGTCFILHTSYAAAESNKDSKPQYEKHATSDTNMSGFSLAISGGAGQNNVKYHAYNDTLYPNSAGYIFDIKSNAGKTSALFQGSAGYAFQLDRFYVGIDAYFGKDTLKLNVFDNTDSGVAFGLYGTVLKHKNFYGFSPKIGYKISPSTLLFVGINIERGRYTLTTTPDPSIAEGVYVGRLQYYGTSPASVLTQTMFDETMKQNVIEKSITRIGFKFGTDMFLSKNVFLRMEYGYYKAPKLYQKIYSAANLNTRTDYIKTEYKLDHNRFLISFGYKF